MSDITFCHGRPFKLYISEEKIRQRVQELGRQIAKDHQNNCPLFIAVLNGSFMFAADLIRACPIDSEITFVKLSSYEGTQSSGKVKSLVGLAENIEGRAIIIVEDIIDTGKTMSELMPQLHKLGPSSIHIASLLSKPEARTHEVAIDYLGFDIPDKFVIGYGLDYDNLARNLKDIYQLNED